MPTSSFKSTAAIVIAAVVAAVSFSVPSVSHLVVSCFPVIYDNTVFLLKPPYLYLVINCIIVSIVATSKLTHKLSSVNDSGFSEVATPVPVSEGYLNPVHVDSDYTGFAERNHVHDDDDAPEDIEKLPEAIAYDDKIAIHDGEYPQADKSETSSESPEKPKPTNDSPEISIPRKPPRFSQQKTLKPNPQGGNKKTALGVTKPPKRQDTLETTWKKITEGRSTPLTKHLKKSDTWQERSQSSSEKKTMTKSENLNATMKETRLKREPSPGQEELNRRVEAFIKKFNEEMRLQRLESLAKYKEMVNGGTCL